MYFIICACIFLLFSNWIMVKDLFNLVDTASVLCMRFGPTSHCFITDSWYMFLSSATSLFGKVIILFFLQMNVFMSQPNSF